MNLVEGQSVPFAIALGREAGNYFLGAAIANAEGAWVGVTVPSLPIPLGAWALGRVTFDGYRLRLSVTLAPTEVEPERHSEAAIPVEGISSSGERPLSIGTSVNL